MPVNQPAPVVLFVYNRPNHTAQALESLRKNTLCSETILYVFADGKKSGATHEEQNAIEQTRTVVKQLSGFKQVIVFEKDTNLGLARSVIAGVTEIVNQHGKVIVLEDDLVVSPFFLDFMNETLDLYERSPNVYSVNGFMYPLNAASADTVLLPFTSTWGWATWASKWKAFSTEMQEKDYLKNNSFLSERFNLASYDYTAMLHFDNNSWGIKWYYSVFIRSGLNVYPTQSLVQNIGFDGSGTNCESTNEWPAHHSNEKIKVTYTESIDLAFFSAFLNYFKKEKLSLYRRLINRFKKIVRS